MLMHFTKESFIRASPERVFAFHELPDVLQRLTPEWMHVRIIQPAASLAVGQVAIVEMRILPGWSARLESEHTAYDPPRSFEDTLRRGPFRRWVHRHIVTPEDGGAILRDEVDYALPLLLGDGLTARLFVQRRLRALFEYRHAATRVWCELTPWSSEAAARSPSTPRSSRR
jgi:ligand-binding SRPBCC domain-containing protein